jgi:hypothetical protein
MAKTNWVKLLKSLAIDQVNNRVEPPSDEALDEFEQATNVKLATSYRGYVKVFGPGRLGGEYVIRAPGYHVDGRSNAIVNFNAQVDIQDFNRFLRQLGPFQASRATHYSDWDRINAMLFFADNSAGDYVCWDLRDVSKRVDHEYVIYILKREANEPVKLADNFVEFVHDSCFGMVGDFTPTKAFRPASRFYSR